MSRPTLEVADILRVSGSSFVDRHGSHLAPQHRKVMDAIVRCRTAALGGHRDRCSGCGHQAISYNSCRNRHCPKCQGNARARWLAARSAELLPVPYFHIVFTLPHELSALVLQNKRLLYDLLFRASAATLLEVARDPKHLGADIGLLSVLHTWGQNLQHHPHVHCVVPGGGLALDGSRWVAASSRFFLPVRVLSRVFRGKFTAELKQLLLQGKLQFHGSLQELAAPERFQRFLRQLTRTETAPKLPCLSSSPAASCHHASPPACVQDLAKPRKDAIRAGIAHSNPIALTASAAPAASFKRPYQNCPERHLSNSRLRARGSPDRVLTLGGLMELPMARATQ